MTVAQKKHPNCQVPFLLPIWLQPWMVEQLFPLDSAGEDWVSHSSYTESPEEASAMGDLAFC